MENLYSIEFRSSPKPPGIRQRTRRTGATRTPSGRRCARALLIGLALLGAPALRADTASLVTDAAKLPFTSVVAIEQTTAPENVLFSGDIYVLTGVLASTNTCTPDNPCSLPGSIVVSTPGIKGVGLTSGQTYALIGFSFTSRVLQVPGSTVVQARLVVILPRSIKPVGTRVLTIPVRTVITFNADGTILHAAAPPFNLVSWWQAENTAADALGVNPGSLSIAETVGFGPGQIGQAFHFENQGFVEVPSAATLEPATLTAAAWVRGTAPGLFAHIISKGASGCDGSSYALYTGGSGGMQFYVFDGTSFTYSPDAGPGLWDGNWHLVAGTFDGAAVRLYVDGLEVGTGTPASTGINYALPTNDNFYIGAFRGSCELRFNGDVDEVQLFSRALTSPEVLGLYNASH